MKRKISLIALAVVLLVSLFGTVAIEAVGPPGGLPHGKPETLPPGWARTNPHTVEHLIGTEIVGGKKYGTYEAVISSLPATLDDNRTLIDTNWYLQTDISGQTWFQTGVNTFTARVSGGRVSVEDEDGRLSVWNPSIYIGGKWFTGAGAVIVDDPINEYYTGNCLRWEYGSYSTGWWIFKDSAPVVRYLRVIEGHITELWILPMDPKSAVIINLHVELEAGYDAEITWLQAYDADSTPLEVSRNRNGIYTIKADEFKGKKFPVTIDPTMAFVTSSYDGYLQEAGTSYSAVRNATSGYVAITSGAGPVGQNFYASFYYVKRFVLFLNTATLPDDVVISSATLKLYGHVDYSDTDFDIVVQSGMPTYPHIPPVAGDYYYVHYSGNGGSLNTSGFSLTGFNYLSLNSVGRGWINKTGWTKFVLRSNREISSLTPTGDESVSIKTYEYGSPYAPTLTVVYSAPVNLPTVVTLSATNVSETYATLEGYLSNDGGESCSVRFQYGTSTSYGSDTAWVSGKTTGTYFDKTVYGLSPGTTYHFRAQAMNSAGTRAGSDITFVTPPYAPSMFTATAGEGVVALTWSKGSGTDRTMVRRSTASYPTFPSSGTQIYFGTGTNHNDNTVVNGTTYYYSAWSWKVGVYSATYVCDYATPYALGVPTVTTNAATAVSTTTATLNLYLNDLGGYATTNVWFQWGETVGYGSTTTSTQKTAPGSHSAGLASLDTGQLYHFRAVAQNAHGTSYGSDKTFTTETIVPTVTTNAATKLGYESATLNLTLTDDGGEDCEVSFEYGLTTGYGSTTPWIPGYSSTDGYLYNLSGLDSDTTYHFRGRARNGNGIGYGSDLTFDTESSPPSVPTCQTDPADYVGYSTATLHGKVTNDGGESCVARFQYGLTESYGTDTPWVDGYITNDTFLKVIADLDSDETYHFRAQVKNSAGTGSGNDRVFVTESAPPTSPTVGTYSATDIGSTTATLHGVLSNDGGEACQVRFQYGVTDAYGTYTEWQDGFTTNDVFEQAIVGLNIETGYHYRAIAENSSGTGYGGDMTFTTGAAPISAPTLTTQSASGVQLYAATLNAQVADDGGATCTVWFDWGLTAAYGSSTPTISGLSTDDIFYYGLVDLELNTTYHYRAVGQNTAGTGYGADVGFTTTTPTAPTVRTDEATDVGSNQAVLNATVLTDGGVECEVRFQWGNATEYGTDTAWVVGYTKDQTFSELITGLTIGETYHFRAQVRNTGGTGSGSDVILTTVFAAPTNFRARAISPTTVNFEWTKTGDQTYIKYKQTGFPIDRADGDFVYLGTGETASISGLEAGTTYYFRAWSWREGDVWADGYSDDVATTQASLPAGEEEEPEMIQDVEEPRSWFQAPSGGAITGMPFYETFTDFAEAFEIPEGSMWLLVSLLLTIIVSVAAYLYSRNALIAVAAGCLTVIVSSTLGMAPLWFILVYLVLSGGVMYVTVKT